MVNYMKVFEVLPQPCLLLEPVEDDFRIWNVNRTFLKLSGLKKEEQLGKSIEEISEDIRLLKSCAKKITESARKSFVTRQPVTLEPVKYSFAKEAVAEKEGNYWSVMHIPVDCETPVSRHMVLIICTDITSQVNREKEHLLTLEELDRSAERSRFFIDKNSDGLYSLDKRGNFISANEGLLNIAEISEKELLKMNFLPFCADYHKEMIWNHFQKALEGEETNFSCRFCFGKGQRDGVWMFL